jgi:hypothetical protein
MPNYLMAFIRKKKVKGKTYYYVVESYKEKGRVKQRVICYIGTADNLLKKLHIRH